MGSTYLLKIVCTDFYSSRTCRDLLAQKDTLVRHFNVFFQLWAPQPCMGIMQQSSTYLEIDERRLHPIVAAAVCAMTSRIVHPGQKQIPFADRCADQVDFYLFRAIDSFLRKTAHENLVVLVCAICHFWHENQMSKVWMYSKLRSCPFTDSRLSCFRMFRNISLQYL